VLLGSEDEAQRRQKRDAVGVEKVISWEWVSLPIRLGSLGASWAPQVGNGRSSGRKWTWYILFVTEPFRGKENRIYLPIAIVTHTHTHTHTQSLFIQRPILWEYLNSR